MYVCVSSCFNLFYFDYVQFFLLLYPKKNASHTKHPPINFLMLVLPTVMSRSLRDSLSTPTKMV